MFVFSLLHVIYLFLVALGLRCCARAFSSCGEQGLLSSCSTQAYHHSVSSCRAQALEHGLRNCGAGAQLPGGMWTLPSPGIEPMSPTLAGGLLSAAPPGKS